MYNINLPLPNLCCFSRIAPNSWLNSCLTSWHIAARWSVGLLPVSVFTAAVQWRYRVTKLILSHLNLYINVFLVMIDSSEDRTYKRQNLASQKAAPRKTEILVIWSWPVFLSWLWIPSEYVWQWGIGHIFQCECHVDVSAANPCTCEAHHKVFVVNVVYPRPFLKSKNFSWLPLFL